jgi:hypothetical protein
MVRLTRPPRDMSELCMPLMAPRCWIRRGRCSISPCSPLEETLARRFGKQARLLNDAEVQGLGIIEGQGLNVVLTFGTGVGSAIFQQRRAHATS